MTRAGVMWTGIEATIEMLYVEQECREHIEADRGHVTSTFISLTWGELYEHMQGVLGELSDRAIGRTPPRVKR